MAEFRKKMQGNLKTLKKVTAAESFAHAFKMIDQLEDMNSEMLFGRLAKECGHDVDPHKLPDLYVNGVKVEVKNIRGTHVGLRKNQERLETAFKRQSAELVAFHTGGDLA